MLISWKIQKIAGLLASQLTSLQASQLPSIPASELLEVEDLTAAMLAGDSQARLATGQRTGYFSEHFLRGVIGLA